MQKTICVFILLMSFIHSSFAGTKDVELIDSFINKAPYMDDFIEVKAGAFVMGSPFAEKSRNQDEFPHLVFLTQDFQIQTTEVTQFQYFSVTGSNPSYFKEEKYCEFEYEVIDGISLCPNHPVEKVSWNDVQKFISQLNEKDDQYIYRLPTEAEWEYAARGCLGQPNGDLANCATTAFYLGNRISVYWANYRNYSP